MHLQGETDKRPNSFKNKPSVGGGDVLHVTQHVGNLPLTASHVITLKKGFKQQI